MKNFNEVNVDRYAPFYTMKDIVFIMLRHVKVWSWGPEEFVNDRDRFLKFKVHGHLFEGQVILGVNGRDLFDVFLVDHAGTIVHEINDVFVGDLIDIIDVKVEKIPSYKR